MAMSFSKPDPASPAAVADASFRTTRRGFDQDEVRDFLRMVAAELGRLQERERFLERELRNAQSNPDLNAVDLDDAALTRLLGEETARVLTTARESANEIRDKAERSGAQLLMEAGDEAARVREEADVEAARRRADAAADAESELEMAKQQGREMVNEARAYRERVLSELARRRELAREQIEQLIHGRDRLTQAFERARLVAADVVAELEPLGEPNEYVNLAPTTGPVPVMVAGDPAPAGPAVPADEAVDEAAGEAADDGAQEPEEGVGPHDVAAGDEDAPPDDARSDDAPHDDAPHDDAVEVEVEVADDVADAPADVAERGDDVDEDAVEVAAAVADDVAETVEPGDSDDADGGVADDDVAEDAADHDAADDDAAGAEAADDRDEVVVDLFARLRAEAVDDRDEAVDDQTEAADDAATDEADGADGADTTDDADDTVGVTDAADDGQGEEADDATVAGSAVLVGDLVEVPADETEPEVGDAATSDHGETPFDRRDAELTPIIVAGGKKLKRVLADEQNEVLDGLRRGDAVTDIDAVLPADDEHLARYRDSIADELLAAADLGARAITGGAVKKLRKKPGEVARDAAGDVLEEWLVVPLRERLDRCVAEGDGDNAVVSRRVRSVYREWKTQHIDEQLDDVVRMAFGRGAFEAVEAGTPLVWTVDRGHPACPDCDDNALAGAVAAGEEFPTGHVLAPAHPGCRCLLLPPDR